MTLHDVESLPRVLVVTSNNFNLHGGGGITLTNLFRGWPVDRIANVHEDPTRPDSSVCANFYQLTSREVRWAWPYSLLERRRLSHERVDTGALLPSSKARGWKRHLVGDGVPREAAITGSFEAWIHAFRPQLVYGFLGSLLQIRLLKDIARRWRVPSVIHIMDDWPAVTYSSGVIGPFARRTILAEFRRVLAEASVRMVISPAMAVEYSRRYGGAFLPFQNALDMHEWDRTARTTWNVSHPSIVRYVGSILPQAQQTSLRDVCDAIAELRDEGFDMTLAVHAQAEHTEPLRSWGFDAAVLRIEPAPNPADVPRLLATADVLVLPTNFDDASVRYVRLSLPTKVPAYMASGTPVLVYGRSDVATVQYAQTSGWGLAVTERDRTSIKTALRRLMTDIELRHTIGRRAMAVAHQNHDVLRVRSNFWDALASATASRAGVGM